MEDKLTRQSALLEILERHQFECQEEVVQAMSDRGFEVTQPSISRDFRELGITKVAGRYLALKQIKEIDNLESPGGNSSLGNLILQMESVGQNMVVIKTTAGAASIVAASIDQRDIPGVAGTIAGDDTIFIAVKSKSIQEKVIKELRNLH